MFIEDHGNSQAPDSCVEDPEDQIAWFAPMSSIWVNDAEMAEWLKATYGLPVYYAPMQVSESTSGAFTTHTVSWRLDGHPENTLTFQFDAAQREAGKDYSTRMFWWNETVLSSIDLIPEAQYQALADNIAAGRVASGKLYPPLLLATYSNDFVGGSDWFVNGSMTGEIRRFRDFECREPLE